MKEGKVTSYLLYAIGEIVLVVAGILIAVRIDSARVERTRQEREEKILKQIQVDLEFNASHVAGMLRKLEFLDGAADSVLKSIKNKKQSRSFAAQASMIHRRFFVGFTSSGYNQLIGPIGVAVQNDSLRNQLVQLYEDHFGPVVQKQNMLNSHLYEQLLPKSNELFEIRQNIEFKIPEFDDNAMDFYTPINETLIFNNHSFANTVINQKRLFQIQTNQLESTQEMIDKTLTYLNQELSR